MAQSWGRVQWRIRQVFISGGLGGYFVIEFMVLSNPE